jgi:hypothetical protein
LIAENSHGRFKGVGVNKNMAGEHRSKQSNDNGGAVGDLNGKVYGLATVGKQANQYTNTTKAIAEYVGREYGYEMKLLVQQGKESEPVEPLYPSAGTGGSTVSDQDKAIWSKKYDLFLKKQDRYEDNKAKVFSIVFGQCEKAMKNQVESDPKYQSVETTNDVAGLLKIIKNLAFNANERKYPSLQAAEAWKNLMKARQGNMEDLVDWHKRFTSLVEMVERSYGAVAPEKIAKQNESAYKNDADGTVKAERDKMLAYMFMKGSNWNHYGQLIKDLADDYALGTDKYPDNVETALQVLALYNEKADKPNKSGSGPKDGELPDSELSFLQNSGVKCWHCGKFGHIKNQCPEWKKKQLQALMAEVGDNEISNDWMH